MLMIEIGAIIKSFHFVAIQTGWDVLCGCCFIEFSTTAWTL